MADEFAAWNQTPWTEAELADMGLRSAADGGRLFCAVEEQAFAINGRTFGWAPGSKVTWGLHFSKLGNIPEMDVKDAITAALKEITDACGGLTFEYVSNADFANIYILRQKLDGPNGVLADCQIPPPGSRPDGFRARMRLDDFEGWVISETPGQGQIDFYRVFLHEVLHGVGLGHAPANLGSAALISPTYSRTIRNLQPADKAELVRRYGPAKAAPQTPAAPTPGSKPITVRVSQDGKVWEGEIQRTK